MTKKQQSILKLLKTHSLFCYYQSGRTKDICHWCLQPSGKAEKYEDGIPVSSIIVNRMVKNGILKLINGFITEAIVSEFSN